MADWNDIVVTEVDLLDLAGGRRWDLGNELVREHLAEVLVLYLLYMNISLTTKTTAMKIAVTRIS